MLTTDDPSMLPPPSAMKSPPRRSYPSDVTDAQWERIAPLLPPRIDKGRPREVDARDILNAVNFRWTTGCAWRMLPHDFPRWETVYTYYRHWRQTGLLPRLRQELTRRKTRTRGAERDESLDEMQPLGLPDDRNRGQALASPGERGRIDPPHGARHDPHAHRRGGHGTADGNRSEDQDRREQGSKQKGWV